MRIGHSHRQAVLVMYGWALLLGGGLVVAGREARIGSAQATEAARGVVPRGARKLAERQIGTGHEIDPNARSERSRQDAANRLIIGRDAREWLPRHR